MVGVLYVDSQADFNHWLAAAIQGARLRRTGAVALNAGQAAAGQTTVRPEMLGVPFRRAVHAKDRRPGLGNLADDPGHPNLVTGEKPTGEGISHVLINGYQGPDNSQGKSGPSIGVMPNRQANGLSNTDIANLTAYLVASVRRSRKEERMAIAAAHPGRDRRRSPRSHPPRARRLHSASTFSRSDAKVIGIQYMITAFLFFLIAGSSRGSRSACNCSSPNGGFVSNDTYNGVYSMHGSAMVWMVDHSAVTGAFGNYVMPLQIGARDVAFPWLNLVSFWMFPICRR